MSDRLGPGLHNPNIMYAPPKDQGGGGRVKERKAAPTHQKVTVTEVHPTSHNVRLNRNVTYMLGREVPAREKLNDLLTGDLKQSAGGYSTIGIDLGRPLSQDEELALAKRQLSIGFGERPDGSRSLYVHNKNRIHDAVVVNRGYEKTSAPRVDNLQRIQRTSQDFPQNMQDDGGVAEITEFANTSLLVPLTTTSALRLDVMGVGVDMTLDAYVVPMNLYTTLRDRAIAREGKQKNPVSSEEPREEQTPVPQKQTIQVRPERPADKPQIILEPGKKYVLGRTTGGDVIQQTVEQAGKGLIEIKGQSGQGRLSKEQLEIEVVSGQRGPELRVTNTGQHNIDITDTQGQPQDRLFGKDQPSSRARRETILTQPSNARIECALSDQARLILEPDVLPDGSMSLYARESD